VTVFGGLKSPGDYMRNSPQGDTTMLVNASRDLEYLLNFLRQEHELPAGIKLRWDSDYDLANKEDPRAICYVRSDDPAIYCSGAIEALAPEVRMGVLLHEVGHLILEAFCGDDCEVDVDDFCINDVAESGYHYADSEYISPWTQTAVLAKNIEHVSQVFLDEVYRG
jgi:hypothetical protein